MANKKTPEKRPFEVNYDYKREFRDWVREQFPEIERYKFGNEVYPALQERFNEVHCAVMHVLGMIMARSDRTLRKYYAEDLTNLQSDYEKGNVRDYTKHLNSFLSAIDVE